MAGSVARVMVTPTQHQGFQLSKTRSRGHRQVQLALKKIDQAKTLIS